MTQLLTNGKKYSAQIKLGWLDRLATNDQVRQKFESVGFSGVIVTGAGAQRWAIGIWTGNTGEVEVPSQIVSISER